MANLKTCGSVWTCAVCSRRICRHRGEEVQAVINTHMAEGGVVWLVTATLRHHSGHRLEVVLEAITQSWTYLKAGAPWQRWAGQIRYVGAIKGQEATHGAAGWHPHIHCLFFLEVDPGPELEQEFLNWLRERWARKVESFYWDPGEECLRAWPLNRYVGGVGNHRPEGFVSLFGRPHAEHGIRITRADKAGAYVAKMGLGKEVSVMDAKGGRLGNRTPWQILNDHMEWDAIRDAALWEEWCQATKGRQHLGWSPGLRERLASSQLELTDEQMAAATPRQSKLIVEFELHSWYALQRAAQASAGEDFGRVACNMIENGGPELLVVVSQDLLRAAGIPGAVRFDPLRLLLWID